MRHLEARLRAGLKVLLLLLVVPGCHWIASFDTTGLIDHRTFAGGCYQNLDDASGPVGVIVFDPREWGGTISGRGSGFFAEAEWTFSEIGSSAEGAEEAQIEIHFTASSSTEVVRVRESEDGIRLEELPLVESTLDLRACRDTLGLYNVETRQVLLWNAPKREAPEITANYEVVAAGEPAPAPIAGDWDGDGTDSYGLWDPSTFTFHLHGDDPEEPDLEVTLSSIPPGRTTLPVAGDWDGLTGDSVGVWQVATRQLRLVNVNAATAGEITCSPLVRFDAAQPVAGDWTATGSDDLALYQRSTGTFLFYDIDVSSASCELFFELVLPDAAHYRYLPMAGNWDGH